ncbi:hypothetical protein [Niallia sp. NCCP-28]|uniref:hypothetical protein n=1 Tax=Niallia sp. NCCP-28 TaxID=2934712 RepID=UPI0020C0B025|nr:hypothetical protein [Niallia sp. NCCP-28]
METLKLEWKIRWYLWQAKKYSKKANKAGWGLDRNMYFQKYCYYQDKARIMEEKLG